MPIRFRCQCGKVVKVGEQYAGRRATCPNCGAQLVVPGVSATPEAGGANAKAGTSAPPSEAPGPELQLETERIGPGGKTAETAAEVTDIEEPAPESEGSEAPAAPGDSAPAAAPPEAASERLCPNCGAAAAPHSVICVECGANLAPEKAPAKKTSGIAKAFQSLREHKSFPLIAAVAVVVAILIATTVMIQVRKSKKPPAPATAPVALVPQPPSPPPPPKAPEKPKPPPEPQWRWPGFSDPAAVARDRILKIGQALAAYVDKNHHPPATLDEAGVTGADSAGCDYVGAEIAALPRFRAMAFETKLSASHEPYVLFSDGSARQVPAAQIPAVLLQKTPSGWATAADAALLAKTAPVIRVANVRFASLEVALDDKPAGVAPRDGACVIPAAAGAHQISFASGGRKEGFPVDLKPGIVYTFVHPWQTDLAWIPVHDYHNALTGMHSSFTVEKTVDEKRGIIIKSLKSPTESVDFLDGDGRSALGSDLLSLAARITREKENLTIEGPAPDKPILVNEIGRLEAGVVRFKSGIAVTYRKTALGALRCEEVPNTDPAAVALSEAPQVKPPALKPGTPPRPGREFGPVTPDMPPPLRNRNLFRPTEPATATAEPGRPPRPGGRTATVEAPPPLPQLTFPGASFTLLPDCEALAAALSSSAPEAVQSLLQRTPVESKPPDAEPAAAAPAAASPSASASASAHETPPIGVEWPPSPQEIPAPLVYGALAFYGDPAALRALTAQYEKTPVESPAYPPLLLALARSGGMSALAYLRTASANAPAPAVIALCTIDDPSARKALADILANWTADQVAKAVDEWPVVAGPACRIAFVETLASANPALLDDLSALNALMKLEPFALERALAARLAAETNGPTPPSEPPSEPPPAMRPGQGPTPAAVPALSSTAPLYWIVLAHFKNGAAVTRFVQLLGDNDPAKRLRAAVALGEVRDPNVVPLLTTLLKDKEAVVRQAAARTLAQMPDAAVVAALDAAMDKDLLVSAIAEQASAIAARAGADATAALLAKMLTVAVKEKAPAVTAPPGRGSMPPSGREALRAAAEVAPPRPGGGFAPPAPLSTAEPGMATPIMILEAINRLGLYSPAVKTALEASDPAVRAAAYKAGEQAIAGGGEAERSASAIAAAGLALKDAQGIVRCAGIGLLSAAEPKAALSLLLPATKDPDADVRAAAVSALPEIADDPRIAAAITGALSDPGPAVVSAAAHAAARRHDPALGAAVLAAINQVGGKPEDQAAMLAPLAEAVGDLQPRGAAGALVNLLSNPQPEVRAAAARAIGKLKDSTALMSLLSVMQDKTPSVVAAAAGALGEFDASEAVQATLDALANEGLAPELRRQILMRLAAQCADPKSAYGSWAANGPPLKDSDLDMLVSTASSAPAALRPGLIVLAKRYLADPRLDARKRAGSILADYPDDPAVRAALLNALEHDAAGLGQAAADVLRRVRDDSMIDDKLLPYYKALSESSGPSAGPGAAFSTPAAAAAAAAGLRSPGPSQATSTPAAPAPAAAGPRFPGLSKVSAEESALLRAAIIEALGNIGGDHAGTALKTIAYLERKRNNYEMTPRLITAFKSSRAPTSVRDLCELYVDKPDPNRLNDTLEAIKALAHMASLDPARVADRLQRLVVSGMTHRDVAAAAVDALDEIQSAGGT